ncbi:MAG: radical SAM protein, partial [Candidatus Caldatribacterium sp.]|nr:radical SAM protein [Candidatus Caldatribacterium sp.]
MVLRERGLALPRSGQYGLALCFPGPYKLGMAHLGFQSLFRLLSEAHGWWGDRFFADTGPRSLALRLPLSSFHIVAFSLSFELDIFPFLAMLKEGGIPLRFEERGEEHPFVLLGGPVVTLNPEIVAPFADALAIGEAEVILPRILAMWE